MEKNPSDPERLKRILVTGPESTGKTELTRFLADQFGGHSSVEYAREYIENLGRPYTFEDVEHIAIQQSLEYDHALKYSGWVFFDTWLIITRVWFEVVYNRVPDWIDKRISETGFDLVMLCAPDIPWVADPVRENGGAERVRLFEKYKKEMDRFGWEWVLVTGQGRDRFERAVQILKKRFPDD